MGFSRKFYSKIILCKTCHEIQDFNTQKFSNFINIQILKGMIKFKMNYDNQCQNARVSMLLKIK